VFLANLSHVVRTPLHAIVWFAGVGAQRAGAADAAAGAKLSHYFARIDQSGERLLALLNDLLDLSRLETARMHYEFGEHDLLPVLHGALTEFESMARTAGVRLSLAGAQGATRTRCDPMRIGQVLRNLLSNAIKFTPSGGQVYVTLRGGAAATPDGEQAIPHALLIEVHDTGVGIPESELEAIFGKFIQSSRTRSNAGGAGLGLAICREIVRAHGGLLSARNRVEGGAVFTVALPLGEQLLRPAEADAISGAPAG
jgi:signal transduction histidine kinase